MEEEPEVETETANDEDSDGIYDDIPTVEEVHATMKQFHLRKRQYQQDDAARRAKSARIRRKNRLAFLMNFQVSMHFNRKFYTF